jgi:eukaryotic-like serine/threonine-protein kinase
MRNPNRSFGFQVLLLFVLGLAVGCDKPIENVWQYQSFSASHSSPALSGDLIVFGTKSGEVHAVTKSGSYRWKFATRKEVISAPGVYKNMIFFGSTNHNFYAVDTKGKPIWKFKTQSRIKGDPLIVDDLVIFGSYDKHLYAVKPVEKTVVWQFPEALPGEPVVVDEPAPTEGEEAEKAEPPPPAIDKSNWPQDAFAYAKPSRYKDMIVVGNLDGYLYAVDTKTGKLNWRWASQGAKEGKGITSTVLVKDGVFYFGANDGNLYAIKADDQSTLWTFKTENEINSSPIMDDQGTIFIGGTDNKFYAVDSKTGKEKWAFGTQGPVRSIPALYKNLVLFGAGDGDGHVYAIDKTTGKEFWKFKTGPKSDPDWPGGIDADPLVDGNRFYIASGDRNLYAFQINKTTAD